MLSERTSERANLINTTILHVPHLPAHTMSTVLTSLRRLALQRPYTSTFTTPFLRTVFTATANSLLTRSQWRPQLPTSSTSSIQSSDQVRGMKVRSSVKKLC